MNRLQTHLLFFQVSSITAGPHKVGDNVSANFSYSDADGISNAYPTVLWYRWDGLNLVSTGLTGLNYTLTSADAGYQMAFIGAFYDDAGNFESFTYYGNGLTVISKNSAAVWSNSLSHIRRTLHREDA